MKSFARHSLIALAAVACLTAGSIAAHATDVLVSASAVPSTDVVLPWGSWLAALVTTFESILGTVLLFTLTVAARHLPAALSAFVTDKRISEVEILLEHAIDYALNMAAVAAKNQTLSVNVGSQTVAVAAQYAIDHGPAHLVDWAGGEKGITQKIIARLPTSSLVDAPVPIAVPAPPAPVSPIAAAA